LVICVILKFHDNVVLDPKLLYIHDEFLEIIFDGVKIDIFF